MIDPEVLLLVDSPTPTAPLRGMLIYPPSGVCRAIRHIVVLHDEHIIDPYFQEPVGLSHCVQASMDFKPIPTIELEGDASSIDVAVLRAGRVHELLRKYKASSTVRNKG